MQSTRRNRRWPRLVLNDDGSNFLAMRDNQTPADLRAYLARYAGTQVDLVAYCVTFGGGICYYDSDVGERLGTGYEVSHRLTAHRMGRNLRLIREGNADYLSLTFAILREHGLPVLASFRMNDAHMSSDPTGHCAGRAGHRPRRARARLTRVPMRGRSPASRQVRTPHQVGARNGQRSLPVQSERTGCDGKHARVVVLAARPRPTNPFDPARTVFTVRGPPGQRHAPEGDEHTDHRRARGRTELGRQHSAL